MDKDRQIYHMIRKGLSLIEDGVINIAKKLGKEVKKKPEPKISKLSKDHQQYQMVEHGLSAIAAAVDAIEIPEKPKPLIPDVDYPTPETMKQCMEDMRPRKGVDYLTDAEREDMVREVMLRIPPPVPGKDAIVEYARIEAFVRAEIAKIPPPKDGEDAVVDYDSIIATVLKLVPLPDKVDYDQIKEFIKKEVRKIEDNQESRVRMLHSGGPTTRLGEISDVNTQRVSVGQVLSWNGSEWVPINVSDVAAVWGSISGTLADQTDLQNALNARVPYTGASSDVNLGAHDLSVADEAYGSGWNGSLEVPTKNAVYDKIETMTTPPGGSDTSAQYNDGGSFGGDAYFQYKKATKSLYAGSFASVLPGTITRTGSYVSSVAITGGRTLTITRSGNYVSSVTDGYKTWTFTRNGSNQITSWAVA